jgi:hypothetical protein
MSRSGRDPSTPCTACQYSSKELISQTSVYSEPLHYSTVPVLFVVNIQVTAPFRGDPTEAQHTSVPDFSRLPYAQVEFLPALQSATGKQFPAPGEELESADALQFLVDICAANCVQVAPPLTLPRVLGRLLTSVAGP